VAPGFSPGLQSNPHELIAAVDPLCTLGALTTEGAQAIQELGARTKRMLRALLNCSAA
jgi:hypothetical protein